MTQVCPFCKQAFEGGGIRHVDNDCPSPPSRERRVASLRRVAAMFDALALDDGSPEYKKAQAEFRNLMSPEPDPVTEKDLDDVEQLFLRRLAEDEPNHPWVQEGMAGR